GTVAVLMGFLRKPCPGGAACADPVAPIVPAEAPGNRLTPAPTYRVLTGCSGSAEAISSRGHHPDGLLVFSGTGPSHRSGRNHSMPQCTSVTSAIDALRRAAVLPREK